MQANNQQQQQQQQQYFTFMPQVTVFFTPVFVAPTPQTGEAQPQQQQQQQQQQFNLFNLLMGNMMMFSGMHGQQFPTAMNEQMYMDQMFQQYQQQQKCRATDKNQMKNLPVYTCDPSCKYQQQFGDCCKECTVCLCESSDKDKLLTLPCMHTFHEECIKPWLESHNSCPVCRYELPLDDCNLEKERQAKIMQEYGAHATTLMDISSRIQKLYADFQQFQGVFELNRIESELTQAMYKIDSVVIPDEDDEELQRKYTWDWNRIKQVRKQLVQRVQFLQSTIDERRKSL